MCIHWPIFAPQRASLSGHWLLRSASDDPRLPAVVVVAGIAEPAYAGRARRSTNVTRFYPPTHGAQARADFGSVSWRDDLLQLARLIDTLSPERDDPEAFLRKKERRQPRASALGEVEAASIT